MKTQGYGKKVAFGFAIFILLLLLSGLSSLWNLRSIGHSNVRVHQSAVPLVREANQIQIQLLKLANLSSLAFSEEDVEQVIIYQQEFEAGAATFNELYSGLEELILGEVVDKKKIAEIKRNYTDYLNHIRRMFDAKIALQNIKQQVDSEADEITNLVDQVGSSFTEIAYFSAPPAYKQEMALISGHVDHADGLMVAVIRTVQEITRTNDPQRLLTAPEDFAFIIKDSMSWFDKSMVLFEEIDNMGLANRTYIRVEALKQRLQQSPNLMDIKNGQFVQEKNADTQIRLANLAVDKCIEELDRLLDSAGVRFEHLQAALAASVDFGNLSVIITIFVLIVLASFQFNSMKVAIQKKINDLATINEMGRQLALVRDQSTAYEKTLKNVCEKTGLDRGAAILVNHQNEHELAANFFADKSQKEDFSINVADSFLLNKVKATQESLFIPDTSKETVDGVLDKHLKTHRALLYIPLIDQGQICGVLCFSGDTKQTLFDGSDFEYFDLIAGVLISTIKNVNMREIIEKHNRSLESTVRERTAALKQKSDDITGMLSNLHQGLFAITDGGVIHPEYAHFLEEIFETTHIAKREFSEFLFQFSAFDEATVNRVRGAVFSILGSDCSTFESLSPHLVREVVLTFSGKSPKNIELSWDPITNDLGQVIKLLVTARDVTEYHKAEEQKEILAAIFKNSAEPVAVFDSALYIQAVNAAFCDLMSTDNEYLVGSNLSTVLRSMHDSAFFDGMRIQIEKNGCWDGEIHCEFGEGIDKVRWLTISEVGCSQSFKTATFLGSFSDILRRQKVEDELRYLANYDALTSLPNRRLFMDRVEHAVALAKRNNVRVALFFIDLNRFKYVNDSYGHSTGDELLVQVTERLNSFVRDSDILCRLGGDEFTILIENPLSKKDIEKFANRLLQQFSDSFVVNDHELRTGASIGISVYPDDSDSVETLMMNADVAMYMAKKKGLGYQFFESKMNETSGARLGLENDLHNALENDELYLTYQPKIDLRTGRMVGAEVLLRWEHPSLGLISPVQFIPLAEETGLIIPIGRWVLETACRKLAAWHEKGLLPINLAVNVSAKQFQCANFTEQLKTVLNDTSVDPTLLELEVTESLLMDTESISIATMTSLKEMGLSISIDDFGTGYSSLQYLSKFPIDYLKIDRSFVMGLDTDGKSVAIIRAIIAMAQGLGLEVIAEGVEEDAQALLLREFGCHLAQGFLYSRPLKEESFVKHLAPQRYTNNNFTFLQS